MKSIFKIVLFSCATFIIFNVLPPKALAVDGHLDKTCSSHSDVVPMGGGGITNAQQFAAGYDHISRYGFFFGGSGTMNVGIRIPGGGALTSTTIDVSGENMYLVTLADPLAVTIGNNYEIYGTSTAVENAMGINANGACYGPTNATINGGPAPSDLHFAVYGINDSELNPTATPAPQNTTDSSNNPSNNPTDNSGSSDSSSSSSTDSGSAPASETTSSIEKATGLKAEYQAATKAVKLTWKKSGTDDIDGYRIYRSEEKTKGFKSVGKVDKKTLEYNDKTVTAGKTYYYFIRAYKAAAESASSETASIAVPAATTSITPSVVATITPVQPSWARKNWPYVTGGAIVLLGGLGFLFWKFILPRIAKKPL